MKKSLWFFCAATLVACGAPEDSPAVTPPGSFFFEDYTARSGLRFVHDAGHTADKHLPETMGAGAAVGDFNGDGHLDLYLVQSGSLFPQDAAAPTNQLWLGDGQGNFTDHSATSGAAAHRGYGMGVAMGDYDLDGQLDLYVTNFGPDVLLRGDGRGGFTDRTFEAGLGDSRWTAGATFFDGDGDGDLDLYVTGYVDYDLAHAPHCGDRQPGWRSYCHPDQFEGIADRYWRNNGDGTFEEATQLAGLGGNNGKGLGVMASDLNNDGHMDLYVANDSVENRLWLGDGTGHFEDGTLLSGTGVNGFGLTEAGMGIAIADLDGNGLTDIFVTNFDDESNTLYRNDGDGLFTDITSTAGLDGPSRKPVGFGTVAADFDDDGDLDLALVNGHIIDNIHLYNDSKRWAQKALLFENRGDGRFANVSAASGEFATVPRVGRGLYTGDFDGDGDLDLLQTENNGPARVFLKRGASPNAIFLYDLPPGARVIFTTEDGARALREAGPQVSYFGACAPGVRYGQGPVKKIEVQIPGNPTIFTVPARILPGRYNVRLVGSQVELVSTSPRIR